MLRPLLGLGAEKRQLCQGYKVTSKTAELGANVANSAGWLSFGAGAVAYGVKYKTDMDALALGCDDLPFDELKEILGDGFKQVNKNVDRNYDAVRENLQAIHENYQAIDHVKSKIDETLKTIVSGFYHIDGKLSETNNDIREGFEKLQVLARQHKIEDVTSGLITFIENFTLKREELKDSSHEERIVKLHGDDRNRGYLYALKTSTIPHDPAATTLHSMLNRIMTGRFGIPKTANDDAAFTALYLLCSGTDTYIQIFQFLMINYEYLALDSYGKSEVDSYNRFYSESVTTGEEFKKYLSGFNNRIGMIGKVINVLDEVRAIDFIKNEKPAVYELLSEKSKTFQKLNSDLAAIKILHKEKPTKRIRYDFTDSAIPTPFLEWKDEKEVVYAVQYVHNGRHSQVGNWSVPYTIHGKACPEVVIGEASPDTTRIFFRKFVEGSPQLARIIKNPNQTKFRDVDRDLYDAVMEGNPELAQLNARVLIDNGANVTASFEHGKQAIHAAAEAGHSDILLDLVKNGADINAQDDRGYAPLHIAAEIGDDIIVERLIKHGADIGVRSQKNWTALHIATKNGHAKTIKLLLAEMVDVNPQVVGGFAPLHMAVSSRKKRSVEMLFSNEKTEVNAKSDKLITPLHLAVLGSYAETVEMLIDNNKCDVNVRAHGGLTALHLAATTGDVSVIEHLVEHNATDVNVRSDDGWSPLHLAISLKKDGATKRLLNTTNVDVNLEGRDKLTPLHLASLTGQTALLLDLLNRGARMEALDSHNYTPLHHAVKQGHLDTVRFFVDNNANENALDKDGVSIFQTAVLTGNEDIVKLLAGRGSVFGSDVLQTAVSSGNLELVEYLIHHKNTADYGRTLLHNACQVGLLDIVKDEVRKGKNVNVRDHFLRTPLHYAVKFGHPEIVHHLFDNGADVNETYPGVTSPLVLAIHNNDLRLVKYLADNGADVNAEGWRYGSRPLAEAALKSTGNLDIMEYLRGKGADVNAKDKFSLIPLHFAAYSGNIDTVKYLVQKGSNINAKNELGESPLHFAARFSNSNTVEYLATKGADINAKGKYGTPLHDAARSGNNKTVEYLVEKGADVNVTADELPDTYYHDVTVEKSTFNLVKYRWEDGPDENVQNNDKETPLHCAVRSGNLDIVKYLVKNRANLTAKTDVEETFLHVAARSSNVQVVKYLVANGADINGTDTNGDTPLHKAAKHNKLEIVNYLLQNGSNITAKNLAGETPLHYATIAEHAEVSSFLAGKCGCVNEENADGQTSLYYAARSNNLHIVQLMAENNGDVNATAVNGWTPLFEAASNLNLAMVEYLVDKGANVNATDLSGNTVLMAAMIDDYGNNGDVYKYLVGKGAQCRQGCQCFDEPFFYVLCEETKRRRRSADESDFLPTDRMGLMRRPDSGTDMNVHVLDDRETTQELKTASWSQIVKHPSHAEASASWQNLHVGFTSGSPSSGIGGQGGAAATSSQLTYPSSMSDNVFLVKWLLSLFGRRSFVNGMNKAERLAEPERQDKAGWAERYLQEGMLRYGQQQ